MRQPGRALQAPLSVLDRLLAGDARDRHEPSSSTQLGLLKNSLRRDLESLLNARKPWRSYPAYLPFLRSSALSYGLEDFAGGRIGDLQQRARLSDEMAAVITRFEPRLTQVEVELVEMPSDLEAVLAFRITAVLLVDSSPEPIVFDTMVDVTTSDIHLRAQQGA